MKKERRIKIFEGSGDSEKLESKVNNWIKEHKPENLEVEHRMYVVETTLVVTIVLVFDRLEKGEGKK